MGRDDWFRGTDWSEQTRRLFEEKLSRARPHNRAQYLRIKGLELTQSGDKKRRRAGRALFRRVVDEYSDDRFQLAMAHAGLAQSFADDGELEKAAEHYRQAIATSDAHMELYADLGLAEVMVQAGWEHRYEEAMDLLIHSAASHDPFPATRFRWNLAAARLAARRGADADARELATIALRCLAETESPFPRHRKLGLASADRAVMRELRRLANA